MATTATNIDSTEALLLTTVSEFNEYAQPLAEQNDIQPYIVHKVDSDQDSVLRLENSRVALLASDFASCLWASQLFSAFLLEVDGKIWMINSVSRDHTVRHINNY